MHRKNKLRTALKYLEKAQRIEMKSQVVANPAGTRLNLCAVLSQLDRCLPCQSTEDAQRLYCTLHAPFMVFSLTFDSPTGMARPSSTHRQRWCCCKRSWHRWNSTMAVGSKTRRNSTKWLYLRFLITISVGFRASPPHTHISLSQMSRPKHPQTQNTRSVFFWGRGDF